MVVLPALTCTSNLYSLLASNSISLRSISTLYKPSESNLTLPSTRLSVVGLNLVPFMNKYTSASVPVIGPPESLVTLPCTFIVFGISAKTPIEQNNKLKITKLFVNNITFFIIFLRI